jgi:hypothetical protein
MIVPLIRSMYGRAFVHVSATLCMDALMRELRRGSALESVVFVGCLQSSVSEGRMGYGMAGTHSSVPLSMRGRAVSDGERERGSGGGDDVASVSFGVAVLSFLLFVGLAFFFDFVVFFSSGAGASSEAGKESKLALRLLSLFLRWGVGKCIVPVDVVEERGNGSGAGKLGCRSNGFSLTDPGP